VRRKKFSRGATYTGFRERAREKERREEERRGEKR
jgi:hypothetical protein